MNKFLVYEQRTGKLYREDGVLLYACYSGLGPYKNDPTAEHLIGRGPIPKGWYTLTRVSYLDKAGPQGPYCIVLEPDSENNMHGRSGFLIHGDNKTGDASHGCIIKSPRAAREAIWKYARRLQVVDLFLLGLPPVPVPKVLLPSCEPPPTSSD